MKVERRTHPKYSDYFVYSNGQIQRKPKLDSRGRCAYGNFLKPVTIQGGYKRVTLYKSRKAVGCRVHRLVLETFVGPCPKGCEACHSDGNPANNDIGNLRWDTPLNNTRDKIQHGTIVRGEKATTSKLTNEKIREIKKLLKSGKLSRRKIAKIFGVCHQTINRIATGQSWSWVQ